MILLQKTPPTTPEKKTAIKIIQSYNSPSGEVVANDALIDSIYIISQFSLLPGDLENYLINSVVRELQ